MYDQAVRTAGRDNEHRTPPLKNVIIKQNKSKRKGLLFSCSKIGTCICIMACLWKCPIPPQTCPQSTSAGLVATLYRRADGTRTMCTCEVQQPEPWGCEGLALSGCLPLAFQGSLCPGNMTGAFLGKQGFLSPIRLCDSVSALLLPQVSWFLQGPQFLCLHSETCTDVPLRSQTQQSVTAEPALCWLWLHCPLR